MIAWSVFFFFNDTATTEIYTLSLHDALPILRDGQARVQELALERGDVLFVNQLMVDGRDGILPELGLGNPRPQQVRADGTQDRKSTRLNSSHANISYAVFCLKKKHETAVPDT